MYKECILWDYFKSIDHQSPIWRCLRNHIDTFNDLGNLNEKSIEIVLKEYDAHYNKTGYRTSIIFDIATGYVEYMLKWDN